MNSKINATLDAARTAVAFAHVAVAGISTVYIGVVLYEGAAELIEDGKTRRAEKKARKNAGPILVTTEND